MLIVFLSFQVLKSDVLTYRCHKCILAARSEYFRAFLDRSPAQPSTHTSSPQPNQSPNTGRFASGWHDTPCDPPSDPSDNDPLVADPSHLATSSSSNSERAATQLSSCTQQHSSQQDTQQQHTNRGVDTSKAVNTAQQLHSSTARSSSVRQLPQLPQLTVSGVSPEVFQLVLEFVYSGSLQVLPPRWLKAAGAELLFEAAQQYLMPLLKVQVLLCCTSCASRRIAAASHVALACCTIC